VKTVVIHMQLQSPMQIMLTVDSDQKVELEEMIKDLEDENRSVQIVRKNIVIY